MRAKNRLIAIITAKAWFDSLPVAPIYPASSAIRIVTSHTKVTPVWIAVGLA
jgi:predicted signal transduction protein with EAL and GGDEF domain